MTTQADSPNQDAKERLVQALGLVRGLDLVESLIKSKLDCEAPKISQTARYLVDLGGKRMRPVMALLCHDLFSGTTTPLPQAIIDVSAGIELIHAATLLHDDIIDKSPKRRNQTSPYIKFGIPTTLLTGDYLLVRAFSLCAHLDNYIIEETEKACVALTEGESLETPLFEERHSLQSYITIASKKTAALFQLAAISGAHIAGEDSTVIESMSLFGLHIGISFQILDDVLDVTADENLLGKKSGMDLYERKPSIINILWLNKESETAKSILLSPPEDDDLERIESALKALKEDHEIIDAAKGEARRYALLARKNLDNAVGEASSAQSQILSTLHALIEYTIDRVQ